MKNLGFGLGLRPAHYEEIFEGRPNVDWFEIISENFMVRGGRPLRNLERIRRDYPVAMHGVSLSVGATDPVDLRYLADLKALAERVQPEWISDHLCWTGAHGINLHDLMPLPYTEQCVEHVAARLRQVQEYLGRRILLENVSSYVAFKQSTMAEWEFLSEIAAQADCMILLDLNNVYVSAANHGFDPVKYIQALPPARVVQLHLAGHDDSGRILIDTHDAPVPRGVWELFALAVERFPHASATIERDDKIPSLAELVVELDEARRIASAVQERAAA